MHRTRRRHLCAREVCPLRCPTGGIGLNKTRRWRHALSHDWRSRGWFATEGAAAVPARTARRGRPRRGAPAARRRRHDGCRRPAHSTVATTASAGSPRRQSATAEAGRLGPSRVTAIPARVWAERERGRPPDACATRPERVRHAPGIALVGACGGRARGGRALEGLEWEARRPADQPQQPMGGRGRHAPQGRVCGEPRGMRCSPSPQHPRGWV